MTVGMALNQILDALTERVLLEFDLKSYGRDSVQLTSVARMQYKGQVTDMEIVMPVRRIGSARDVDELIREFETHYTEVYTRSARFPEAGFLITGAASLGAVATTTPVLPMHEPGPAQPVRDARKGMRKVFWHGRWLEAEVWEMDRIQSGNAVNGFAVIEDPATTLVVPPGMQARLDQHRIFHLSARQ